LCRPVARAEETRDFLDRHVAALYEMQQQGKSREDIVQFMTDRYGDFVLYKPAFKGKTSVLWIAPIVFLMLGLITVFFVIRRKKAAATLHSQTGALERDVEKQKKIRSLLEKGDLS